MANDKLTFETKLKNLEKIAKELENPEAGLAKSLEQYKLAMSLIKECQEELNKAEEEIKIVAQNTAGEITEQDFTEE